MLVLDLISLNLLASMIILRGYLIIGYLDFIKLLKYASLVITDSGGVQREAYLLHVPCPVPRDRTEWVELVEKGYAVLVDVDKNRVIEYLSKEPRTAFEDGILGDGRAGKHIARIIYEYLVVEQCSIIPSSTFSPLALTQRFLHQYTVSLDLGTARILRRLPALFLGLLLRPLLKMVLAMLASCIAREDILAYSPLA